jgi:hypothetical protein
MALADPKTETTMATELRVHAYAGGIAGEDFSVGGGLTGNNGNGDASGQFLFVCLNGTRTRSSTIRTTIAATNRVPLGISQNDPKTRRPAVGHAAGPLQDHGRLRRHRHRRRNRFGLAGRGVKKAATLTGANLGDWVMGVCVCAADVGECRLGRTDRPLSRVISAPQ